MRAITATVFDLGGVVLDSPLHAIAAYERERGLPPHAINEAVLAAGDAGAWSRLERGEQAVEEFSGLFEAECRAAGVAIDAADLMACVDAAARPRPRVLAAIGRIRAAGLQTGALTNTWHARSRDLTAGLERHFDVYVESRVVGMRKPDPRMYELVCRRLGVPPSAVAYLDDIGANLKPARALGMTTIRVQDPDTALWELGALLGLDLTS